MRVIIAECPSSRLGTRLPACLIASLRLPRSLSLPPRWSSQLGWMRLIFDSSCANAALTQRECSVHSNLSHRLIYSLPDKPAWLYLWRVKRILTGVFLGCHHCCAWRGSQQLGVAYRKWNLALIESKSVLWLNLTLRIYILVWRKEKASSNGMFFSTKKKRFCSLLFLHFAWQ